SEICGVRIAACRNCFLRRRAGWVYENMITFYRAYSLYLFLFYLFCLPGFAPSSFSEHLFLLPAFARPPPPPPFLPAPVPPGFPGDAVFYAYSRFMKYICA